MGYRRSCWAAMPIDDLECATPECQTTLILLYSAGFEVKSKAMMKPHIVGDADL
jgi:hypothetical protein